MTQDTICRVETCEEFVHAAGRMYLNDSKFNKLEIANDDVKKFAEAAYEELLQDYSVLSEQVTEQAPEREEKRKEIKAEARKYMKTFLVSAIGGGLSGLVGFAGFVYAIATSDTADNGVSTSKEEQDMALGSLGLMASGICIGGFGAIYSFKKAHQLNEYKENNLSMLENTYASYKRAQEILPILGESLGRNDYPKLQS